MQSITLSPEHIKTFEEIQTFFPKMDVEIKVLEQNKKISEIFIKNLKSTFNTCKFYASYAGLALASYQVIPSLIERIPKIFEIQPSIEAISQLKQFFDYFQSGESIFKVEKIVDLCGIYGEELYHQEYLTIENALDKGISDFGWVMTNLCKKLLFSDQNLTKELTLKTIEKLLPELELDLKWMIHGIGLNAIEGIIIICAYAFLLKKTVELSAVFPPAENNEPLESCLSVELDSLNSLLNSIYDQLKLWDDKKLKEMLEVHLSLYPDHFLLKKTLQPEEKNTLLKLFSGFIYLKNCTSEPPCFLRSNALFKTGSNPIIPEMAIAMDERIVPLRKKILEYLITHKILKESFNPKYFFQKEENGKSEKDLYEELAAKYKDHVILKFGGNVIR